MTISANCILKMKIPKKTISDNDEFERKILKIIIYASVGQERKIPESTTPTEKTISESEMNMDLTTTTSKLLHYMNGTKMYQLFWTYLMLFSCAILRMISLLFFFSLIYTHVSCFKL